MGFLATSFSIAPCYPSIRAKRIRSILGSAETTEKQASRMVRILTGQFNQQFNRLVQAIRGRGSLSVNEACMVLGVGPWQIKHYARAIVERCADIRYDGKTFQTIVEPKPANIKPLSDYLKRER